MSAQLFRSIGVALYLVYFYFLFALALRKSAICVAYYLATFTLWYLIIHFFIGCDFKSSNLEWFLLCKIHQSCLQNLSPLNHYRFIKELLSKLAFFLVWFFQISKDFQKVKRVLSLSSVELADLHNPIRWFTFIIPIRSYLVILW